MHWILIMLYSGQLGRTNRQASIITDNLEPLKGFYSFFPDLFENGFVTEEVQRVSNRNISLIGEAEFGGVFLDLFFRNLKTAVTGHAGNEQLPLALLCNGKVAGGEVDGQLFIRAVGRTGAATGPIF
jgi:hypothetical protein